jgi:hypothetical protein
MPILSTQEEVAAHLQQSLRDRDRWILLGIGDRGKRVVTCLLATLLAYDISQDELASCALAYLDLGTRERLDARLLTLPRSLLTHAELAVVLEGAGYSLSPVDQDVVSIGGTPETGRVVAGFIDTCVNEHFAPAPGMN